MRNRAKCKLCGDILESFHHHDFVSCKCGEISIDGGMSTYRAVAKDWKNFLRVDDQGNEIIPKIVDADEETTDSDPLLAENVDSVKKEVSREDKLLMLEAMIKNIENLPESAMSLPINHYDFYSALLLLQSILKE